MPLDSLEKTVKQQLRFLLKQGFRLTFVKNDPGVFGNGLAILERGELRLRIVRDRGQEFVDVGRSAEPDAWFDLGLVLDALAGVSVPSQQQYVALDVTAPILQVRLKQIEEAFGGSRFESLQAAMRVLASKRKERLFPAG